MQVKKKEERVALAKHGNLVCDVAQIYDYIILQKQKYSLHLPTTSVCCEPLCLRHETIFIRKKKKNPSEVLPRISLKNTQHLVTNVQHNGPFQLLYVEWFNTVVDRQNVHSCENCKALNVEPLL